VTGTSTVGSLRAEPSETIRQLLSDRDQLVEALIAAQDRLGAIVALMELTGESLELAVLAGRLLGEALALTDSDAILLRQDGEETFVHRCDDPSVAEELACLLRVVMDHGSTGAGADDPQSYAIATVPGTTGAALGVARKSGPRYCTGDLRMVEVVSTAADTLTRFARLHLEVMRRAKVEREHQLASALSQAVMPVRIPQLDGASIYTRCAPAAVTGGDFLTVADVNGTLWFAVGDVAGKGLPAATVMTRAVAAIRVAFLTQTPDDPAGAVTAVAEELDDYLNAVDSFITLLIGTYQPGTGVIHLCNAGHSPVILRRGSGCPAAAVPASLPPLGVQAGRIGSNLSLPFHPGAMLVVGTDGLVEQPAPDGSLFGYDRFLDACDSGSVSARDLGAALFAAVDRHADGTEASDDRTLVVVGAEWQDQ